MTKDQQIKMLLDALQNVMGAYDTPLSRRRFPPDDFMKECVKSGREVLEYHKTLNGDVTHLHSDLFKSALHEILYKYAKDGDYKHAINRIIELIESELP